MRMACRWWAVVGYLVGHDVIHPDRQPGHDNDQHHDVLDVH